MRWPRRDVHALSGAYALDAVSESERKRFERHLARCAACRREVSGLQEAASRFAVAVGTRPPAGMRARVLEAVAADEPITPAADAGPSQAGGPGADPGQTGGPGAGPSQAGKPGARPSEAGGPGAHPSQTDDGAGTRPRRVWERGWVPRVAIPLAAACLALAVVFVVLFAVTQGRLNSSRTQEDAIADVLSAPGTRVISRKTSIGGTVIVDVASAIRELVITTDGMPGLPASEAYQVWVLEPSGKAASDGMLTRIADHRTAPVLAAGLVRGDKMGLTVEPAGGTAKPTTRPIVDIPVSV
jgi:anti-sigma-K factor RskA